MAFLIIAEAGLDSARYVSECLCRAGHETRYTDNQIEALAIYQERRADLLLTDSNLEGGSGLALIRTLKKLDPSSLLVMATSFGNETLASLAFRAGVFDYLIKDGDYFEKLPELVQDILDRNSQKMEREAGEFLKFRLEAQSEMAGWLDHNFRNMLSASMGSLSLISFETDQPDSKKKEYLSDCFDSLKTAVKLLDGLSGMTGDESGEPSHNIVVASVVDEAYDRAQSLVRQNLPERFWPNLDRLSFINNCRSLVPQQVVYQDLLSILEALLKNALEAVNQADEPRIMVRAEKDGPYIRFSVLDNGRGMDENVLRHAFEPLFSTKGQVGVGLSLAMVRTLVLRHKGEVKLFSTPEKGTTVNFSYFSGTDH